jgi:hypothetical protein
LPANIVSAIAIDGWGNKWIGTGGGGLAVYREGGVILLYVSDSQLKFGRVYIPNSLSLKLKIKNVGNQTISLNGVSFNRGDVFKVLNSFPISYRTMIQFLLTLFLNHCHQGSIKIQQRFQRASDHLKFI